MRPLPASVFSTHEALQAGWTMSALKCAVRGGRLVRLRRGVYTAADAGRHTEAAAIAAARVAPRAVVSHRSALLLHGLPLVGGPPPIPELTVPPRSGAWLADTHLHRAGLRDCDIATVDGIAVTSVARTVIDVARHRPTMTAVAALDAALHQGRASCEELTDVLRFCRRWPRVRRGHVALALADPRSESPLESISRVTLHWLGIPSAALQPPIFDQRHRFVGRPDFYWDEFGVVGEADGVLKYGDRADLVAEKRRQEAFEDLGLVVVRWGWQDVLRRRDDLEARIRRAFARGRARDRAGFPRLWRL